MLTWISHLRTGSPVQLKSKLQDFGIPSSLIPISDSGEVLSHDAKVKWTERRMEERLRRNSLLGCQGRMPPPAASTPQGDIRANMEKVQKVSRVEKTCGTVATAVHHSETELSSHHAKADTSSFFVHTPGNYDILLGRGRLAQKHVVSLL
jgi:hypothetical protein